MCSCFCFSRSWRHAYLHSPRFRALVQAIEAVSCLLTLALLLVVVLTTDQSSGWFAFSVVTASVVLAIRLLLTCCASRLCCASRDCLMDLKRDWSRREKEDGDCTVLALVVLVEMGLVTVYSVLSMTAGMYTFLATACVILGVGRLALHGLLWRSAKSMTVFAERGPDWPVAMSTGREVEALCRTIREEYLMPDEWYDTVVDRACRTGNVPVAQALLDTGFLPNECVWRHLAVALVHDHLDLRDYLFSVWERTAFHNGWLQSTSGASSICEKVAKSGNWPGLRWFLEKIQPEAFLGNSDYLSYGQFTRTYIPMAFAHTDNPVWVREMFDLPFDSFTAQTIRSELVRARILQRFAGAGHWDRAMEIVGWCEDAHVYTRNVVLCQLLSDLFEAKRWDDIQGLVAYSSCPLGTLNTLSLCIELFDPVMMHDRVDVLTAILDAPRLFDKFRVLTLPQNRCTLCLYERGLLASSPRIRTDAVTLVARAEWCREQLRKRDTFRRRRVLVFWARAVLWARRKRVA